MDAFMERRMLGLVNTLGTAKGLELARTYQIGRHPATAALPPASEIGDRKLAFMGIASAVPLIPVII